MILEIEKVIFEAESGGMDLLGFQTAFENKFTDKIMPGITVLTKDVRYYGFICWAINNNINPVSDEERFFNEEQRLVFRLAKLYCNRDKQYVSYLGIRKASMNFTQFKPPYYKTSIWAQYKNSMKNLGLLQNSNEPELTENGREMARLFKKAKYDKKGIKDKNLEGVKIFFSQLLFNGNDKASKIRKEFKGDLLKAIKNKDFYKSLGSSPKRILRYAAITTQIIQHLTDALRKFHVEVKKQNKRGSEVRESLKNNPEIVNALKKARVLAKRLKDRKRELEGLKKIIKGNNDETLKEIINRHIEVKIENPLFIQKNNRYFITKNKPPENVGVFGFRQGALESLLRSLDRMAGKE